VSYDIHFLSRLPGQSWHEALEATEEADVDVLSAELQAAWNRIVPAARALLGDVDEFTAEDVRSLSHDASAIQLTVVPGEVAITVPYWYEGERAAKIIDELYALAEIVERETGLEGYDPQLDRPVANSSRADASALLDETTKMVATLNDR
jgi:hypothetical protein